MNQIPISSRAVAKLARCIPLVVLPLLLGACVATPTTTFKLPPEAPASRHVLVNITSDPDLIALDVQTALESEGLQVDLSLGESEMSQMVLGDGVLTEHRNISYSKAPYELIIAYRRGGYPYQIAWRAVIRDRYAKKVIGTYKYDFNAAHQSFGWKNEKIVEDMINQLIIPFWGED